MRLCPNCGNQDGHFRAVRCKECGADLLPEHISEELVHLRMAADAQNTVAEKMNRLHGEMQGELERTRKALKNAIDDFEARTTDEAIGRAMRRLGAVSDEDVKNVERAIDSAAARHLIPHEDDPDIPF